MSVGRLLQEISILRRVLSPQDFRAAALTIVKCAPQIIARRSLAPLDEAMSRDARINYKGKSLVIPVAKIDRQLAGSGDSATFGIVREMFGADVYLRAFKPLRNVATVVDLGSNRGFFMLLAAKLWEPKIIIGLEPTEAYNQSFSFISEANDLKAAELVRINKFVGGTEDERSVTLGGIIESNGLSRIDFLKCDIEGSEYAAFTGNPDALKKVANLAMEVHPWCGSTQKLVEFLISTGLTVMTTDQHGHIVGPDKALYLYASREGQLQPPFYAEGVAAASPFTQQGSA